MIDYFTYYYRKGTEPFRSLSSLSDEEAIKIMKTLADDTPFGSRFKDPVGYFQNRRESERWTREAFIAKGGKPQASYPIPMVLGSSKWMVKNAPDKELHAEIQIPLSIFTEVDVSFTYPDSMISRWLGLEKPADIYEPDFHGQVFTLSEIQTIIAEKGLPEEGWENRLPVHLAPYIEAQVWRHEPIGDYK
ncbi:MAG: hypothetical protein DWQ04_04360 [Chloroflexi bacterium]|nr:MAG: hypothetical protein DWQ04_04360 [Chloroflexota bacterium]